MPILRALLLCVRRAERQKGNATRLRLGASRIVQASQSFPGKLAAWPFLVWARRGMIWRISKVVVDGFRSLWANALNGTSLFPKTPLLCQDLLYCLEQQGSSHCKQCPETPKILFFSTWSTGMSPKSPHISSFSPTFPFSDPPSRVIDDVMYFLACPPKTRT